MKMNGSNTDFSIEFSGTSVLYHAFKGDMILLFISHIAKNLTHLRAGASPLCEKKCSLVIRGLSGTSAL